MIYSDKMSFRNINYLIKVSGNFKGWFGYVSVPFSSVSSFTYIQTHNTYVYNMYTDFLGLREREINPSHLQ